MTIYIESFLIQNLVINLCILRLVRLSTKYISSHFRIILSSLIGAVMLVFSAIFITNSAMIKVIKLICPFIMILFTFRVNKKQFLTASILYFLFSYALYGGIIALTSTSYMTSYGSVISSKFNVNLIIFTLLTLTYIYELVLKNIKNRTKTNSNIVITTLTLKNNSIKINAFLDTGNTLTVDGQSVIIIDRKSFLDLTNLHLLTEKSISLSVNTVSGKAFMQVYKIDKVTIKHNKQTTAILNPYIAVSDQKLGNNFNALLSPNLLNC